MTRGIGIAKRGFGKALSRTGYADGGKIVGDWEEVEKLPDTNVDVEETIKDLEKYKKGEKFEYRTPPHEYDSKGNIIPRKPLYKKGGSAKPGLWANINRRKKLGISRPKSKSTISAKAYANMKAGFPKKKK